MSAMSWPQAAWGLESIEDRICKGSTGRSDRNIAESILLKTAASLHNHLPHGASVAFKPLPTGRARLERMIPAPDAEFVRGALEAVGVEDPRRAGLEDRRKRWACHAVAGPGTLRSCAGYCRDLRWKLL